MAEAGAAAQILQRYGAPLFDREVSTFAPTDDALVPDEYRLGAVISLSFSYLVKKRNVHAIGRT